MANITKTGNRLLSKEEFERLNPSPATPTTTTTVTTSSPSIESIARSVEGAKTTQKSITATTKRITTKKGNVLLSATEFAKLNPVPAQQPNYGLGNIDMNKTNAEWAQAWGKGFYDTTPFSRDTPIKETALPSRDVPVEKKEPFHVTDVFGRKKLPQSVIESKKPVSTTTTSEFSTELPSIGEKTTGMTVTRMQKPVEISPLYTMTPEEKKKADAVYQNRFFAVIDNGKQATVVPAFVVNEDGTSRFLSKEDAKKLYEQTGQHFAQFSSLDEIKEGSATKYAQDLEWQMQKELLKTYPERYAGGALKGISSGLKEPVTAWEKTVQELHKELLEDVELERARERHGRASGNLLSSTDLAINSGLSQFITGVTNTFSGVANKTGRSLTGGSYTDFVNRYNDALQRVVAEERSEMGTLQGIVFDLTRNTAQNAPAMVMGFAGGGIFGGATTFASTFGTDRYEMMKAGYGESEATTYAFFNALNQSFLDYLGSMPGLGGVSSKVAEKLTQNVTGAVARSLLHFGINAAGEAGTEWLQSYIEAGLQNAILGIKIDPDALSEEALYSALLGALSAGMFDVAGMAGDAVATRVNRTSLGNEYITGKNGHSIEEAIQYGLSNAKGTDAYRAAEAIQQKYKNNEKISAYEVGRMIEESQTLQAMVAKAIETQILKSAKDTGANLDMAREVAAVAARTGRPILFANKETMLEGEGGNYNRQTGVITLNAAISKEEALEYVIKHELAHSAEKSKLGGQLEQIVRSSLGESFDQEVAARQAEYAEKGRELTEADAVHEVVAHWIGNNLYSDGFVKAIVNGDASVGNSFLKVFDRVRLALGGTKKSRTAANIAIVERLFMRALEQSPTVESGGGTQNYINPNFISEYEAWDKKSTGGYFVIGTTSKALESIGINPSTISWDKSKIVDILNNPTHYMEDAITQVPELLENPIVIMQSNTVANRVVLLGDVYDAHGNPVLCALELTPKGNIQNLVKIASAYGKESGLQSLIDSSRILYLDPNKKRTDNWLQARRLQLPVGVTSYGSIGRVTLFERNVKGQIEISGQQPAKNPMELAFEKAQKEAADRQYMQNSTDNSQSSFLDEDVFSMDGPESKTTAQNGQNTLDRYDQRTYTNHGWVTVNQVLTGKEQTKLYAQWADAVENRFKYPQTPKGETIITVGDGYADADTLVFISGSNQNPIISEVVKIVPGNPADVSAICEQLIDGEEQGDVYCRTIIESTFGQGVLVSKQSGDFAGYRQWQNAAREGRGGDFSNRDRAVGPYGNGSNQANVTRDREIEEGLNVQESPSSQDDTGFSYAQNQQSSFLDESAFSTDENTEQEVDSGTVTGPVQTENWRGRLDGESVVSRAQTMEELEGELGEEGLYRRLYTASQIDRPPATVTIDGREVNSIAYMDDLYTMLPDDDVQLTAYLHERETQKAAELAERFTRGETEDVWTELDLQIMTARSKLEWGTLDPGEDGKKTRRFYEQRLKGNDTNKAHQEELLEVLAGRNETYNPIANQKTLEKAKERLRGEDYTARLRKRILRYKPGDILNEVDAAAAQLMINDARNAGDLELYADLTQGLSRKGTAAGRAVQILSLQARMTPEGTLRAAQKLMRKQADNVLYDGASEDLDILAETVTDALEEVREVLGKGRVQMSDDIAHKEPHQENVDYAVKLLRRVDGEAIAPTTPSREQLTDMLVEDIAADGSPYITKGEIRAVLERAVFESSNIPDQLKRNLKKKLGNNLASLAERIDLVNRTGHLNDVTMRRVFEEALGLPSLTSEDVKTLTELSQKMNDQSSGSLAQAEAMEDIYRFLGEKLPVNKWEMLQSWRKFGMLFNVKTHMRNIFSNLAYAGINRLDNTVSWLLERLIGEEERTTALGWSLTAEGQAIKPLLEQSYERALLQMRKQGKYEIGSGQLGQYRKMFGESKVGEVLNKASDWNSRMMEKEDTSFFRNAYINALGQIAVARGLTQSDIQNNTEAFKKAEEIAQQRAEEAVFRASNILSDVLKGLKHYNGAKGAGKTFGYLVDIAIPFTQTPASIAAESFMHTPLGLVKSAYDLVQMTRGKSGKSKAQIINEVSKGITGSILFAIGLLLGNLGLFNTGYGKSEKERAADELAGRQENSFQFGDVSISLDWLQPTSTPLVVGASFAERLGAEGLSLGSVFGAAMDGTDSLFEMTMLQSLYDILGGYDAGASTTLGSIAENAVSQSIPTLVGQLARAIDPVQRKTSGESAISNVIGDEGFAQLVQQVMAKIPGLTFLLEPELDVWGNTVYRTGKATSGNAVLNAFQQFVIPANIKQGTGDDEISQIVRKLYEESDAKMPGRALPTAADRDELRELGLSYEDANRLLGKKQYALVEELINDRKRYSVQSEINVGNGKTVKRKKNKLWSEMTDDERLRVLQRIYTGEKDKVMDSDSEYYKELIRRLG